MGSTRLPGKTLADLAGKPLLQHLVERIQRSPVLDDVMIATTTLTRDDVLAEFAERFGLKCYRGSEDDVLDRMYQAARQFDVDTIVRVTPDCPLLDHKVMDRVILAYTAGDYDYVSNTLRYTYPDGLDVEIFSSAALERTWKNTELVSDREHVTPYMRNSGLFRTFNVASPVDLSHHKWSVDTAEEFAFVTSVFDELSDEQNMFDMEDVISLLEKRSDLMSAAHQGIVNEGYYRSLANDPPVPVRSLPVSNSAELKERARKLIPSYTQTFSKGPTQFVQGMAPVFLSRGEGSHTWDVDGNEYVDQMMALGPVILGHNYPRVNEAVTRQMQDGVLLSLPHPIELELAERLEEIIPCAEMVRFGKNGSDATSGAVRASRAYTGRDIIACCGYHGWQDWFIGTTTRDKGVPAAVQELTIPFKYNDIGSLQRIFDNFPGQVAAVIMEPVGVVEPEHGFLAGVRELASKNGAVLVFDEIITGFRLSLGGAQEHYGIIPDLACFGKAMANGYPLSAVVGCRDIMEEFDEVFFSFTNGGETLSLAASMATIDEMQDHDVIGHLWAQGKKLKDGYNVLAKHFGIDQVTSCVGLPPHSIMTFESHNGIDSLVVKSLFQQECLRRGVLTAGYHNPSYSLNDTDVDYTLRVYRSVLEILGQAISEGDVLERLLGEPVQSVIREA